MTTTAPQIQVYASLPLTVASGPNINLNLNPSNWRWVHCLTLPVQTLNMLNLSHRPYKWIHYSTAIIIGAEGHLSTSSTSLSTVNYDAGLPDEPLNLYYHTSTQERQRMFPADPDIGRTSVTSSTHTSRRDQFRDEVAERDGRQCVLSGLGMRLCDAVHLLAHSKGDTYISTYTQQRSRDPTGGDIIYNIDNIRNGLLLNNFTHRVFGKDVAFLMTPNFAMSTSDIDPAAPPGERRCTAHLFLSNEQSLLGRETLSSGSPVHMSDTNWPPAILFDAIYAGTVLHHFGTQMLQDALNKTWKNTFYPGGVATASDADFKAITDSRAATMKSTQTHAQERQTCYESHHGPDAFDMLMTLPYILIPPNELQAALREPQEKAGSVAEQEQIQKQVETWRKQVNSELLNMC